MAGRAAPTTSAGRRHDGWAAAAPTWQHAVMAWVLDCDGVVWLADEVIPGAPEAVERLRAAGQRVVFLTNNSYPRRSEHVAKLARLGMPTPAEDVITSSMAAAAVIEPGERVLVLGGPGVLEELAARGVDVVEPGDPGGVGGVDAVVVGFDLKFDFGRLAAATTAVRAGARLVATNDDATFPTGGGLLPGAGSFVAAVAKAGGVDPIIAGKPFAPVVTLLRETVSGIEMVVGDRPSTDGQLAERIGTRFGLVLSGVTPAEHGPIEPTPAVEAPDLLTLVGEVIGPAG